MSHTVTDGAAAIHQKAPRVYTRWSWQPASVTNIRCFNVQPTVPWTSRFDYVMECI